jgi:hypothetical protein
MLLAKMKKLNIYYIYFYLRRDGTPYYIGRGKKNRAYAKHIRRNGVDIKPKDRNNIKIVKINLTKEQSLYLEKKYIQKYGRKEFGGILINIKQGGEDVSDWTPNMKDKMSKLFIGKKLKQETKIKMSIAHKGKKPTIESLKKMVETRKKLGNYNPSKETKEKMSQARIGKFTGSKNPSARPVHVYSKDNIFINTFTTGREAAKVLNLGSSWKHIPECCNGKRKHIQGYKFKYAN